LTRSVAIAPALAVSFLSATAFDTLDNYLNILQSVQLPFALLPLIKFAADPNIMREFAISKCHFWFSTICGVCLFIFNFVVVFDNGVLEWW
jgi:Mn2+/Fe2+ NRAMP family transporter